MKEKFNFDSNFNFMKPALEGCLRIAIFSKIEECPKKLPQVYA